MGNFKTKIASSVTDEELMKILKNQCRSIADKLEIALGNHFSIFCALYELAVKEVGIRSLSLLVKRSGTHVSPKLSSRMSILDEN